MTLSEELKQILNRIEKGHQTEADINVLPQLLRDADRLAIAQLAKYNVNIGEGRDIHIGDRTYYDWDEEALNALVRTIRFGDVDEGNLLVAKLNNVQLQGEEGDRKTGIFYTYNIGLEDVSLEKSQDSTENNRQSQQYTIKGKWDSKVYKEINVFGLRVDRPWGKNKKPWGNFSAIVEILNGRVVQIKVDAARRDDSANNYAADKAEQLIKSKISEVLPIAEGVT